MSGDRGELATSEIVSVPTKVFRTLYYYVFVLILNAYTHRDLP